MQQERFNLNRIKQFFVNCRSKGIVAALRLTPGQGVYYAVYSMVFIVVTLLCMAPFLIEDKIPMLERSDGLNGQYVLFTYLGSWLREIVSLSIDNGSLTIPQWNHSMGYGSSILPALTGTLGDPLNYISALVPSRYAEWAFSALIIVRQYLSGITFSIFCFSHKKSRSHTLIGSILYAFSGWMLIAFTQSAFVMPLVLLPMILLGIDRVFEGRSPVMFIIFAALLFLDYFYFMYMLCIALIPYCFVLYWRHDIPHTALGFLKWFIKVVVLLIVAALIAGCLLFPTLAQILEQSRLSLNREIPIVFEPSYYLSLLSGFVSYAYLGIDDMIGGGCFAILSCTLLLINHRRVCYKVFLLLIVACATIPILSSALNGFSYTCNRWMWLLAFYLAYLEVEMLPIIERISAREYRIVLAVSACLGLFLLLFPNTHSTAVMASFALLLILVAFLGYWVLREKRNYRTSINIKTWLLVFAVISILIPYHYYLTEDGENLVASEVDAGTAWLRHTSWSPNSALLDVNDDSIWRFDSIGIKRTAILNNGIITKLNGYDSYSSFYNEKVDRFNNQLEIFDSPLSSRMMGLDARSFLETALGTKYFLIAEGNERLLPYGFGDILVVSKKIAVSKEQSKKLNVYASSYSVPIACYFSKTISPDLYGNLSAMQRQQVLLQAPAIDNLEKYRVNADDLILSDIENEYKLESKTIKFNDNQVQIKDSGEQMTMKATGVPKGELCVEFCGIEYNEPEFNLDEAENFSDILKNIRAICEHQKTKSFSIAIGSSNVKKTLQVFTKASHLYSSQDSWIINLGMVDEGDYEISITFNNPGTYRFDSMKLLSQPMDSIKSFTDEIKTSPVSLSESINCYDASIHASEPGVVVFSVPYSSGWTATIDGNQADILLANTAFMAIEVPDGDHSIHLSYKTPGLKSGCICSLLGVLITIAIALRRRYKEGALGMMF